MTDAWLPLALLILIPVLIWCGYAEAAFIYIGYEPSAWAVVCGADTIHVEAEGGTVYAECENFAGAWVLEEWIGELECEARRVD